MRRLLAGLRPGMTEREAVRLLDWNGMPLSCHLMLSAGPRAASACSARATGPSSAATGSRSPSASGARSNCRAGFVVADAAELPAVIRDYVDRLVGPYFEAVAEWYGALRIGQTGGALHEIVDRRLGDPFFGIFLNPGHQLHLDEWVNSPISPGSTVELRSGMAFQVDIIPATGSDVLHHEHRGRHCPRRRLAARVVRDRATRTPGHRIEARRRFMAEALGIELHPDVLPFSNLPAFLPPFLLRPDLAMTMAG